MFVWGLWKEMMDSSLEMAARTTLTSLSIQQGADAKPDAYKPASFRNDPVFTEYHLFQRLSGLTATFIDEKGAAHEFSANWQEQTGLSPYQCYLEHFIHFFHPQHRSIFQEKLMEVVALAETEDEAVVRFRAQYGSTHHGYEWYEFSLTPHALDEETGEMIFAMLMRDISREIGTERSLRAAQIESELALQARTEFLGHMSHELRTPLNAILGFAEMMEQGVYGNIEHDTYAEYLANIRESGDMLLHRINDMLEIADIEMGDAMLDETRIEPETLLETAKKLHRHEAFAPKGHC